MDIPDEVCANGGSEVPALVCSTLGIEDDACTVILLTSLQIRYSYSDIEFWQYVSSCIQSMEL